MSQDLVDDVLVFNTPVRRIGYDPDRASAVTTRQRLQTSMSILNTRLSRCYHALEPMSSPRDVRQVSELLPWR
jgi:hypothetical protein